MWWGDVGGRGARAGDADRRHGASCLYVSAHNRHLDTVKALLKAGGRELLLLPRLTADDGTSCLSIVRGTNQREVCRLLQGAGDGMPERQLVFA